VLPAIFISTLSSVVSGILKDSVNASIAVCILTAANSFILALITYLKLDAKSEAHRISAYSFEKLQSLCEFKSGKILLTKTEDLNKFVSDFLEEIENKYKEIKEGNQFIIPESIQLDYPFLYYTNIFAVLKTMRNQEMIQINKLKVIMNKGADIQNKLTKCQEEIKKTKEELQNIMDVNVSANVSSNTNANSNANSNTERQEILKHKLEYWLKEEFDYNEIREIHYVEKNQAIEDFLQFRNKYYMLTDDFNKEITYRNAMIKSRSFSVCACLKT
jgi:hypothetical protein